VSGEAPPRPAIRRVARRASTGAAIVLALLVAGPLAALALGKANFAGAWWAATHRPTGIAPDPAEHSSAVVQAYAARTFGWRGAFGVHTWIAAKPAGADRYTRYEVIGWLARDGGSVVSVGDRRAPDAEWYGNPPELLRDLRGPKAEAVIAKLGAAAASYPYATRYSVWPGPNSNTFIAHVARAIPELGLAMPANAIGKDYVEWADAVGRSPSGTGWQVSAKGVVGLIVGGDEGFELNLLGLVVGVDPRRPAVKLPGFGSVP
jgi:hypothetical protein